MMHLSKVCLYTVRAHVKLYGDLSCLSRSKHTWLPKPTFCQTSRYHRTIIKRHYSLADSSVKQVGFGLCIDIDGVLARGRIPVPGAQKAMDLLYRGSAQWNVPVVFVTNALNKKSKQLSEWFGLEVVPHQVVQAQSPLSLYGDIHHKHCLLIGQGPIREIAKDLGFTNICTIEDVEEAYPEFDIADINKRLKIEASDVPHMYHKTLPPVQAIISMGEPKHWETPIQLIMDLLFTHGNPLGETRRTLSQTLPVYACNPDLQYMHKAPCPRLAHGAFLLCMEAMFKKLTGSEMQYSTIMGKPSEVTLRYAEHCVSMEAERLSIPGPIRRIYMIGDNQEVDIVGANLYQQYLSDLKSPGGSDLPTSRQLPPDAKLLPQTVDRIHGILVRTGVYHDHDLDKAQQNFDDDSALSHSHRDFPMDNQSNLLESTVIVDDILAAVEYIFKTEGMAT